MVRSLAAKERTATSATINSASSTANDVEDVEKVGDLAKQPSSPFLAAADKVGDENDTSTVTRNIAPTAGKKSLYPAVNTATTSSSSRSKNIAAATTAASAPASRLSESGENDALPASSDISAKPSRDGASPASARRGLAAKSAAVSRGGTPGRSRAQKLGSIGGFSKRPSPTRVELLDLEADLHHVRAASKVPVGEILVDVRQAMHGLRQAKDELERVFAEEKIVIGSAEDKEPDNRRLAGEEKDVRSARGRGSGEELDIRETVGDAPAIASSAVAGSAVTAKGEKGEWEEGQRGASVRKLAGFVKKAEVSLRSIDQRAIECVDQCKELGEFFGEGSNEAQSAHIFRTLVQFLDLLREAKKAENVC